MLVSRRKILFAVVSILTISSSLWARSNVLTIGSYNVENLWDGDPNNTPQAWDTFKASLSPGDLQLLPPTPQYAEFTPEKSNYYDPNIQATKVEHVVEAIKLAGVPDILGLQEIESAGNTSRVFEMKANGKTLQEKLQELGYQYFIIGKQEADNPTAVTTAFISKIKITELPSVKIRFPKETYSTSARDIQVVEARIGNNHLVLMNGHWKSKLGGGNEATRVEIAKIERARIEAEKERDPNVLVVALGDFNSGYFEKPLVELGGTSDASEMQQTSDSLFNLWYQLPSKDRWETKYNSLPSTLSAMLISDGFFHDSSLRYLENSFHVIGQSGPASKVLLDTKGNPKRWLDRKKDGYTTYLGEGYSDHLPIVASFSLIPNQ